MVEAVSGLLYPDVRENTPVLVEYESPAAEDESEERVIKLESLVNVESVVGNVASDKSPRRY